jgi:hypothetical protein
MAVSGHWRSQGLPRVFGPPFNTGCRCRRLDDFSAHATLNGTPSRLKVHFGDGRALLIGLGS